MDDQSSTFRKPLFHGSPFFGLVFILMGFLILYLFGQTSQLFCNRQAD